MHQIAEVHIKNFRSCADVHLTLDECTPLVGYNNAGKSNLLDAINWLISPTSLEESDFFRSADPVSVQARVQGVGSEQLSRLDPRHQSRIEPMVSNETLWIRRQMDRPDGRRSDNDLAIYDPHEGHWRTNPSGIDKAVQGLFPEPIRIGAMEDAAEDATKSKRTTTIGRLLAQFTAPLEESHGDAFEEAIKPIREQLSAAGAERVDALRKFDREATERLITFFPGIQLHLDIQVPDIRSLLGSGTIRVSEKGREAVRSFGELGHGAQRSIQMALVRYLADFRGGASESPQTCLLLMEEPELFLHPQAIEQIRVALDELSLSGYQVVFATHSPMMVGRDTIPRTQIVRKDEATGETRIMPKIRDALERRVEDNDKHVHALAELKHSSG